MRFKIHHSGTGFDYFDDCLVVSGDTIEEIQSAAKEELARRGWKETDCWSEELPC